MKEGQYVEVYVNPSKSELMTVAENLLNSEEKAVRFIADLDNKKLYVFSPYVFHDHVKQMLKAQEEIVFGETYMGQMLKEKGSQDWFIESKEDELVEKDNKRIKSAKYKFLLNYVSGCK
jgi:hypothetical protein